MASNLVRSIPKAVAVNTTVNAAARTRHVFTSAAAAKNWVMNDPIDHATGLEKYELLKAQSGSYDPFFMKASKRGQGTRQEPNVVNSLDSFRCIGCICNEGDTHINWMWLYEGKPKRCECGYWFELKYHPAPEEHKLPL